MSQPHGILAKQTHEEDRSDQNYSSRSLLVSGLSYRMLTPTESCGITWDHVGIEENGWKSQHSTKSVTQSFTISGESLLRLRLLVYLWYLAHPSGLTVHSDRVISVDPSIDSSHKARQLHKALQLNFFSKLLQKPLEPRRRCFTLIGENERTHRVAFFVQKTDNSKDLLGSFLGKYNNLTHLG